MGGREREREIEKGGREGREGRSERWGEEDQEDTIEARREEARRDVM